MAGVVSFELAEKAEDFCACSQLCLNLLNRHRSSVGCEQMGTVAFKNVLAMGSCKIGNVNESGKVVRVLRVREGGNIQITKI